MKTDFPELEQLPVFYEETKEDGIVAGCCYDVGITIVNAGNTEDNLYCLNRSDYVKKRFDRNLTLYKQRFYGMVKLIRTGAISIEDYSVLYPPGSPGVSNHGKNPMATCAFSQ